MYVQGSVASFHFRNELSLRREGDLLGEGQEGGPGRRQAAGDDPGSGRRASGPAGRQAGRPRSGSAVARGDGGGGGDLGGGVRVRRLYLIYAPQCT